jgi:hypothetical protein
MPSLEIQRQLDELADRVSTLEQFAEFISQQLEPEDDDVEGVLEAFHRRFATKAKGGRG